MRRWMLGIATMIVLAAGSIASAHPGPLLHDHVGGLGAGALHPFLGLDHLLVMVTVGLLAVQAGGRAVWTVPGVFLGGMVAGGLVGMRGAQLGGLEFLIATSVAALGAALIIPRNRPLLVLIVGSGLFGFWHGQSHGAEIPVIADPAIYAIGFVASTAAIHAAGILVGSLSMRTAAGQLSLRLAGGGIALVGFLLMLQAAT